MVEGKRFATGNTEFVNWITKKYATKSIGDFCGNNEKGSDMQSLEFEISERFNFR
ncbi:hypothetical protein FORC37_2186 [Vibrio vulnificus]|nr:hypothetical protein FORC37_2186 [Vibrio vulnificus]